MTGPSPNQGNNPSGLFLFMLFVSQLAVATFIVLMLHFEGVFDHARAEKQAEEDKWDPILRDAQYKTGIHEAGHAFVARVVQPGRRIDEMWVWTQKKSDAKLLGSVPMLDERDPELSQEENWQAAAIMYFAGQAAEEVILNRYPPDDYQDKDYATDDLWSYCDKPSHPCGECPISSRVGDACLFDGVVAAERARRYQDAKQIVMANREAIIALADELTRQSERDHRRTMTGAQIDAFLKERGIAPIDPRTSSAP